MTLQALSDAMIRLATNLANACDLLVRDHGDKFDDIKVKPLRDSIADVRKAVEELKQGRDPIPFTFPEFPRFPDFPDFGDVPSVNEMFNQIAVWGGLEHLFALDGNGQVWQYSERDSTWYPLGTDRANG